MTFYDETFFTGLFGRSHTPSGTTLRAVATVNSPVDILVPFFAWACSDGNCFPKNYPSAPQTVGLEDMKYGGNPIWIPDGSVVTVDNITELDPAPDFVQFIVEVPMMEWWPYQQQPGTGDNTCGIVGGVSVCGPVQSYTPSYHVSAGGATGLLDLRAGTPGTSLSLPLARDPILETEPVSEDSSGNPITGYLTDGARGPLLPGSPAYTPDPSSLDAENTALATLWSYADALDASITFDCAPGAWSGVFSNDGNGVYHPIGGTWLDIVSVSAYPLWLLEDGTDSDRPLMLVV
jgi:hypothetical protein